MKHFILLLTFSILSTFIYSQSNTNTTCGCIEILFTNSPQELKPEHFAFTTDVPVVEIQPDKLTKVLFCYNNYNKALFLLNTFTKYYPKATIIEKKSIQIESLPKLFATIQ
jgi:hypothetical protein